VADLLTGLIWLKNANCFNNQRKTWKKALDAAKDLVEDECGLTDDYELGDWRLPTVRELMSLIDYGYEEPALSNLAGTGHCPIANNPNDPNDPTNCPLDAERRVPNSASRRGKIRARAD
jgi:hypothetical protein